MTRPHLATRSPRIPYIRGWQYRDAVLGIPKPWTGNVMLRLSTSGGPLRIVRLRKHSAVINLVSVKRFVIRIQRDPDHRATGVTCHEALHETM